MVKSINIMTTPFYRIRGAEQCQRPTLDAIPGQRALEMLRALAPECLTIEVDIVFGVSQWGFHEIMVYDGNIWEHHFYIGKKGVT
jgi:hypothetical protein